MGIFRFKKNDVCYDNRDDDTYNSGPAYTPTEAALIRIADALEKIATNLQTHSEDNVRIINSLEKIDSDIRILSDDGK